MTRKTKPGAVVAPGRPGVVHEAVENFNHDYRTISQHFQALRAQADALMQRDSERYAQHFQIWMSLQFAANGWPWAARLIEELKREAGR